MSDDWFSEFVYEVVIDKKFLTEEILAVTKQTPVVLPAWDPMGALAKLWVGASDRTVLRHFSYWNNKIISMKISILCNICWITVHVHVHVLSWLISFKFLLHNNKRIQYHKILSFPGSIYINIFISYFLYVIYIIFSKKLKKNKCVPLWL